VRAPGHQASECLIDGVLRFEKNDILRIVRALAIFRPSLIALQMPLTEEDEIFVEKCVQRSVIVSSNEHCGRASSDRDHPQELNKLISYSGTPTVVWRRTGEICLVGPEFSMLTEWSKEELLGTKKYIWEVSKFHLAKCGDPHVMARPLAFREPVGCRILGKLRHSCLREHSAIS
jgi:hypothetical protein